MALTPPRAKGYPRMTAVPPPDLGLAPGDPLTGAESYVKQARAQAAPGPQAVALAASLNPVTVIGAGALGGDIARALVNSGRRVVLIDRQPAALTAAQRRIGTDLTGGVASETCARLRLTTDTAAAAGAKLVIEARPDTATATLLADIAMRCDPDTILATTSTPDAVTAIAADLPRGDRVIGIRFILPTRVQPLLELVPAPATADTVRETMRALAVDLGALPITTVPGCRVSDRLSGRLQHEAMFLVEEGAWPEDVDHALERWGMKIGPFRALDLIGTDAARGDLHHRAGCLPLVGGKLCDAGLTGRKTGKGWFIYDADACRGRPYEESRAVVLRSAAELRITRRNICADEIVARCLTALILEACAVQQGRTGMRPGDVDLACVDGHGFPAAKGGPLFLGAALGAAWVRRRAQDFRRTAVQHPGRWQVPDGLDHTLDPGSFARGLLG